MNYKNFGKWFFGISGTIVLGAIGSGFWELAMKDYTIAVGHGILNAITFGYGALRDSYYADIAQGHNDRAVLWIVSLVPLPLVVLISYMAGQTRGMRDSLSSAAKETRKDYNPEALAKRRKELIDATAKHGRSVILVGVFGLSLVMFRFATLVYTSGAISHFEQAYAICLPYLSEQDRAMIRSEFAQINTRADYERVIGRLHRVATDNGVKVPKFLIW